MTLVLNEARFHEMSSSQHGSVGRHLGRIGVQIELRAKEITETEGHVRSGHYRDSIKWNFVNSAATVAIRVGSALPIARLLEHGSPPHVIAARRTAVNVFGNISDPKSAGGLFWQQKSNVGGRNWAVPDHPLQSVNHPGQKQGYRIIARAVEQVLRRHA